MEKSTVWNRTVLVLLTMLSAGGGKDDQPASTAPSTAPTGDPASTIRSFIDAIDQQKRDNAVAMWDTSTKERKWVAEDHVDMMLAIARLKHNVADKWGAMAPYDLQMGVVTTNECGDIGQTITGETALVTVASNDPQTALVRGSEKYHMIRVNGRWVLSADEDIKGRPANVPMKQEQAAAQHLIGLIDQVAKDVKDGKCANTNDVLKHISEGMGGP